MEANRTREQLVKMEATDHRMRERAEETAGIVTKSHTAETEETGRKKGVSEINKVQSGRLGASYRGRENWKRQREKNGGDDTGGVRQSPQKGKDRGGEREGGKQEGGGGEKKKRQRRTGRVRKSL
jgi:hypothetical protein